MWGWDESEESGMRVVLGMGMDWGWRWARRREEGEGREKEEGGGSVHSLEAKNMMPVEKGRERRAKVGC